MIAKKLWYGGIRVYIDNDDYIQQNIKRKKHELKVAFIESLISEGFIEELEDFEGEIFKYQLTLVHKDFKKEIIKAYNEGYSAGIGDQIDNEWGRESTELTAEQYYNETYSK
jgi:hypothetical protein